MSILNHSYSLSIYQLPSYSEWEGSKPQKFKGGRKHDNHPMDQLDNLLLSHNFNQSRLMGPSKKRFEPKITIGTDLPPRPHIRTDGTRNESKVVFDYENIPKLIKIPPSEEFRNENSILFRNKNYGESKLKNLQAGELKTGIYRNLYRSQFLHDTRPW